MKALADFRRSGERTAAAAAPALTADEDACPFSAAAGLVRLAWPA